MRTSRSDRFARRAGPGRWLGLVAACALVSGCAYQVRLRSLPPGATVVMPDGSEQATPSTATFQWGKQQVMRIQLAGYRPLAVDMQRTEGPLLRYLGAGVFQKGGREITYVLVEEAPALGEVPVDAPAEPAR